MIRGILLLVGIIIVVGLALGGSFVWDAFVTRANADAVEFVVEQGASVSEITEQLSEQGLITSEFFFKTYIALTDQQANLQAGTFSLAPGMSFSAIVGELAHAEASETQVTIPEGYTSNQIGEVIVEAFEGIDEDSWGSVVGEDGKWMLTSADMLGDIPSGYGLEGYLFPDTYRFRTDADAATIVDSMVLNLERRLAENDIVVPEDYVFDNGQSLHEVITLASIVEREVRSAEDMALVAGIFFTRLKIGMALQADSTVNYVTGKKDAAISIEDSQISSPYNTYQNLGLPPGPISNPGMNAIMAVLNPQDSSYLYFLTTEEGEVIYATSFDQHIENKYQYLK